AGRNWRRKADLVPAVVHAQREALFDLDQVEAEAIDHRKGEIPVGDGGTERTLLLRPLDIDVNPLVVTGQFGKCVDLPLADLTPFSRPDLPADQFHDLFRACNHESFHGATVSGNSLH